MPFLPRIRDWPATAVVVEGVSAAFLVGRDGSPAWQVARVAGVGLLTVLAAYGVTRPSTTAAAVAWLAGIVGVSVGVGIGVFHLAKSGPLATTLAGLGCLVSGAFLLTWGVAGLVRAVRGLWRRLVVTVVVVVAAALLVVPTAPAFYVTNVPRPAVGNATPADRGLDYREVRFRTPDGATLAGWYVPSRNGAAVALLHGASSTRSAVLDHAVVLARGGYGVLLYDARGHGGSTGRAMDFGWYGDQDVTGAVSFLAAREDVDPGRIGLVGMSMGGEQALGAAASDDRVRAVVAEGATGRTAADNEWFSEEYGVRGSLTEAWTGVLEYGLVDLLTAASPPVSLHDAVAATAPRPVLLITASTLAEEAAAARYIRSASPRTVSVWDVPGAAHTGGLETRPGAWEQRVVAFLDRSLTAA
jgi:pimeloyl-ACP methyl ester carboxylesterase